MKVVGQEIRWVLADVEKDWTLVWSEKGHMLKKELAKTILVQPCDGNCECKYGVAEIWAHDACICAKIQKIWQMGKDADWQPLL